jgi:hypothetical protein
MINARKRLLTPLYVIARRMTFVVIVPKLSRRGNLSIVNQEHKEKIATSPFQFTVKEDFLMRLAMT